MNLLLFLSDRCSMRCDYCFLDLNGGAGTVLSSEAAQQAVDEHLRREANTRRKSADSPRITILGGEPFIHFDLLSAVARQAIQTGPAGTKVTVVTNGTLATPEKIMLLQEMGVTVTISVDGNAPAHNLHRKLLSGLPSHQKVIAAFEASVPARANLVISQDTAGNLLQNIEYLRRRGFRKLSFHLNILEQWTEEGLRQLRTAMDGFTRYWDLLCRTDPDALELVHLSSYAEKNSKDHRYDDLVLGADGRYYPCDAFLSLRYDKAKRWSIGDATRGVDWPKREEVHQEALASIHSALHGEPHYTCPREAFFLARLKGQDPRAAVQSFHRADRIFGDALSALSAGALAR